MILSNQQARRLWIKTLNLKAIYLEEQWFRKTPNKAFYIFLYTLIVLLSFSGIYTTLENKKLKKTNLNHQKIITTFITKQ